MKQQRNGRKVQNWHRPLGKNALRQRFLKHRKTPVPAEGEIGSKWDWDIDPYYFWEDWGWDEGVGGPEDVVGYAFASAIQGLVTPRSKWIGSHSPAIVESQPPLNEWQALAREGLIASLVEHKRLIGECSAARIPVASIWNILDRLDVQQALIRVHSEFANLNLLCNICWFAPFWIRHPAEWLGGDVSSLIDHLFVRYGPPAYLYSAWSSDEAHFKWISWFLVLAQGAELPLAGRQFEWVIPRRLVQFLYDVPTTFRPTEACVYAEIRRRGGGDVDIRRVLRNPAFIMDPTEPGTEVHSRFWRETICWLIENRNRLSDAEADLVLSWSMHEFTEAVEFGQSFSMAGRGVRSCLERSRTYHHQITFRWEDFRWDDHGWNWSFTDAEGAGWAFEELTSGIELYSEGIALRHCVATYASRCVAGISSITSVKRNGVRCVTVEIDPRNGRLVQARGLCNREADDLERQIIQSWRVATVAKSFT